MRKYCLLSHRNIRCHMTFVVAVNLSKPFRNGDHCEKFGVLIVTMGDKALVMVPVILPCCVFQTRAGPQQAMGVVGHQLPEAGHQPSKDTLWVPTSCLLNIKCSRSYEQTTMPIQDCPLFDFFIHTHSIKHSNTTKEILLSCTKYKTTTV